MSHHHAKQYDFELPLYNHKEKAISLNIQGLPDWLSKVACMSKVACTCAVTLCYSVRRRPSISFVIFNLSWAVSYLFYDFTMFLFLQHYVCISRDYMFRFVNWRCCVVRFLWFSTIVVVYVPVFGIKRRGLVTPPGGADNPQFPTRPHSFQRIGPWPILS